MAELTVLVPVGDREIELRKPTDGALVVLARTFRGLPKIENIDGLSDAQRERLVRNLGTLGKIVDEMIVQDVDRDWLEDAMIEGGVTAEEMFGVIRKAGEKFNEINGQSSGPAAKKAAPAVRRRR